MITIRQQLAPEWWKLDENDTKSASFHIRPLSQLMFLDLKKEIGFNEFDRLCITAKGVAVALENGLLDWQGVFDEQGQPLKCTRANQANLPIDVLTKLAYQIADRSRLGEEQKKSSPSPSTSR